MNELLEINNLMYDKPVDISAVANSTMNTYNFAPNSYENSTGSEIMQIQFNEGLDFVDGNNSYIRLKLRVNNVNPFFSFSQNLNYLNSINSGASVLNIIKSAELVSKDGNTYFKEELKNQLQCLREYKLNECRKNYLSMMGGIDQNSSYGVGIGYPTAAAASGAYPIFKTNTEITFIIPLQEISPFFSSCSLIHPKFLESAVLRLRLEQPEAAIRLLDVDINDTTVQPFTITISNMAVILSEKELYKEVEDKITQEIKLKGLNYAYYQSLNTIFDIPQQDYVNESFVFPISLSAAKIKYLAVKPVYKESLTTAQQPYLYPMSSIISWNDFSQFSPPSTDPNLANFSMRIRLGNKIYPENYQINQIPDFYNLTTYAMNNISFSSCDDIDVYKVKNKQAPCCVGGNLYNTSKNTTGGLIWAFNFERSQAISNSGLSTNQERLLSLEINNYNQVILNKNPISLIVSVQFMTVATLFENGEITVNK